jgi:uncharacterized membrane protein
MEDLFKLWTGYLASGVEAAAGIIIALAALQAVMRTLPVFFRRADPTAHPQELWTEQVRLKLGRWLALALEFELGADILRTAITPTWTEIGQLAAIAAIRTLLNYFLQKEIERAAQTSAMVITNSDALSKPSPQRLQEMTKNVDNVFK